MLPEKDHGRYPDKQDPSRQYLYLQVFDHLDMTEVPGVQIDRRGDGTIRIEKSIIEIISRIQGNSESHSIAASGVKGIPPIGSMVIESSSNLGIITSHIGPTTTSDQIEIQLVDHDGTNDKLATSLYYEGIEVGETSNVFSVEAIIRGTPKATSAVSTNRSDIADVHRLSIGLDHLQKVTAV